MAIAFNTFKAKKLFWKHWKIFIITIRSFINICLSNKLLYGCNAIRDKDDKTQIHDTRITIPER